MHSFTKLFSTITDSSIWSEDSDTRVVWVTLLAMADRKGRVFAAVPGLAKRAAVSIAKTEEALTKFMSPDPYSRTADQEGRRIEIIEGGWRLINYQKYRDLRDNESEKERKREWWEKNRGKGSKLDALDGTSQKLAGPSADSTQAEAEAEAEAEADPSSTPEFQSTPTVTLGETKRPRAATATDGEWISGLKGNPAYAGIDVDRELGKAQAWCDANGKQLSRRRFINWLNRADKPIHGTTRNTTGGGHGAYRPPVADTVRERLARGGDTWAEAEGPAAVGERPAVA